MRCDITILNEPPILSLATIRHLLRLIRYRRGRQRLGGPPAVAANLRLGLDRAGIAYRVNPRFHITGRVGVLSDADTLRWAISQRRAGRIRRLIAGPNFPQPVFLKEIVDERIDLVVVASEWLRRQFIEQAAGLRDRIAVWPVGVDEEWWTPSNEDPVGDVLVYSKTHPMDLLTAVLAELARAGLRSTVLRYASHDQEGYRAALRSHRWALFLSEHEGQGIALLEAWSCGVPTLAWDPGTWRLGGQTWSGASSAPYTTVLTGLTFGQVEELPRAIAAMERGQFDPRVEVMARFTAKQCARAYASLFEERGSRRQ